MERWREQYRRINQSINQQTGTGRAKTSMFILITYVFVRLADVQFYLEKYKILYGALTILKYSIHFGDGSFSFINQSINQSVHLSTPTKC